MPSTWLQTRRIAAAFAASTAKPGWTAPARSTNRATASDRRRASGDASPSSGSDRVGHVDDDLAGDPERLPAGGQDADVGAGAQERSRQDGRGVVDVLAVVEDQERPLVGEVRR